jgi:DNA-binding response OmpR family regulator
MNISLNLSARWNCWPESKALSKGSILWRNPASALATDSGFLDQYAFRGAKTSRITSIESIVLHYLLANRGSFVTGAQLAGQVWGENYPGCERALRVHIRHLRTKIEDNPSKPHYIITIAGEGYSLPR